jgi:hypothetical protein
MRRGMAVVPASELRGQITGDTEIVAVHGRRVGNRQAARDDRIAPTASRNLLLAFLVTPVAHCDLDSILGIYRQPLSDNGSSEPIGIDR